MHVLKLTPEFLFARTWHYIKFEYFVPVIEDKALWFSSADSFGDLLEGSLTLAQVQHRDRLWDEIENPAKFRESVRNLTDWDKQATFVNCWSLNESECALMWAAYVKGDGVAVQTTVERLRKAVPSWVRIVPVRYVDHDTVSSSFEHSLDKFCLKGVEFRTERELRLLIEKFPAGHPGGGLGIEPHGHRLVEVDLDVLIESIVLSPKSDKETAVKELMTRAGLSKPVLPSRLSRLPYR